MNTTIKSTTMQNSNETDPIFIGLQLLAIPNKILVVVGRPLLIVLRTHNWVTGWKLE
jgi:hypothetical protein